MAMDRIMPKDDEEKKFFKYQHDWYTALEKFIKDGDKLQKKLKEEGAIAPTEVLMFLLFWETLNKKYKGKEIDFLRHMLLDILENDQRFLREFQDDAEPLGFDINKLKMKKDTIH